MLTEISRWGNGEPRRSPQSQRSWIHRGYVWTLQLRPSSRIHQSRNRSQQHCFGEGLEGQGHFAQHRVSFTADFGSDVNMFYRFMDAEKLSYGQSPFFDSEPVEGEPLPAAVFIFHYRSVGKSV